jgi:hypothetical protein
MTSQIIDSTTKYGLNKIEEGGLDTERLLLQNWYLTEAGLNLFSAKDRNLTAPPGSPADQDCYIIASGASGDWSGKDGQLAVWSSDSSDWIYLTPNLQTIVYLEDEELYVRHNGTIFVNNDPPFAGFRKRSVSYNITASSTQTQGQQVLTTELNVVSSVGAANDVVTLPSAEKGLNCIIWNLGNNALQIYPSSGDRIDEGSIDVSVTLAVDGRVTYWAVTDQDWLSS